MEKTLERIVPPLAGIIVAYTAGAAFCIRKIYSSEQREKGLNQFLQSDNRNLRDLLIRKNSEIAELKEALATKHSRTSYWTTAVASGVLGVALTTAQLR